MIKCKIRDGRTAIITGFGPLSTRFKSIVIDGESKPYLVWADTLMYRLDGAEKPEHQHPLDVIETYETE